MPTTLEQLQYGFDRDSRRTWRQRATTQGWDNAYVYDSLSQVSGDDRGDLNLAQSAIAGIPSQGFRWDYDETGNWQGYQTAANGLATLNQERTHDKGNRLMEVSGAARMRTDRAGRMVEAVPGPGQDWDSSWGLKWDAWSRIVEAEHVPGGTTASYQYDGVHRRITRHTTTEDVTLHSYYNDAWRPVEERKDAETTAAASYLWGARHRDDLVRRDRAVGGTSLNETRYILMDYFSPAAITDSAGAVKERYQFSAFGLRTILNPDYTVRSSSECAMEFGFQGQFEDVETGWLNYGYRYYLPALGRWACKDPIEDLGGSNLYHFSDNNPINAVDFLGLVPDFPNCCDTEKKAWEDAKREEQAAQNAADQAGTAALAAIGAANRAIAAAGLGGAMAGMTMYKNRLPVRETTPLGRVNRTSRKFDMPMTSNRRVSSGGTRGSGRVGLILELGSGLLAGLSTWNAFAASDAAVAANAVYQQSLAELKAKREATKRAKKAYDDCVDMITDCRCGFP
ncbi:MAG: RHS repeat-associated core domain-containing protein [Verrucomicrobiaceae bacterium]|nr:RHS repeat-associated core domain-containing protein [Verrucomicrobiaceae bacterium]